MIDKDGLVNITDAYIQASAQFSSYQEEYIGSLPKEQRFSASGYGRWLVKTYPEIAAQHIAAMVLVGLPPVGGWR